MSQENNIQCPNCNTNDASTTCDAQGKIDITFCSSCGYTKEIHYAEFPDDVPITYEVKKPYGSYKILKKSSRATWTGTLADEEQYLRKSKVWIKDPEVIQVLVSSYDNNLKCLNVFNVIT
jgi:transcription elongation factor Elf1